MTIAELMRELDAQDRFGDNSPHIFGMYRAAPYGVYCARMDLPNYEVLKVEKDTYEEATEFLIEKVLDDSGVACSVCGSRHLPVVMLETDEPESKPLCNNCAQHANDTRPMEAE